MTDENPLIARADRVSDRVIDAINDEREAMIAAGRIEPFALVSGLSLALITVINTAPPSVDQIVLLRALRAAASAWCAFYMEYAGWREEDEGEDERRATRH